MSSLPVATTPGDNGHHAAQKARWEWPLRTERRQPLLFTDTSKTRTLLSRQHVVKMSRSCSLHEHPVRRGWGLRVWDGTGPGQAGVGKGENQGEVSRTEDGRGVIEPQRDVAFGEPPFLLLL